DPLVLDGEVPDGPDALQGVHQSLEATSWPSSTMRFEKPHSLSYQAKTLANRSPITWVMVASKIDEAGLPMKSPLTSGSSVYSRMPFMGPSAAAFMAAWMVSLVTARSVSSVRSTRLTSTVGTRMACPSNLPL